MSGESAENEGRRIFRVLLDDGPHGSLPRTLNRRLRIRTYAIQAGTYKVQMLARGVPEDVFRSHRRIGTSNWIWVVELQDRKLAAASRRCVVGEIAFDATSDQSNPNPLFGHLPRMSYVWPDPRRKPREIKIGDYAAYATGAAAHDAPAAPPLGRSAQTRARSRFRRARVALARRTLRVR